MDMNIVSVFKFWLIVPAIGLSLSCDRRQKQERPLEVTRKILSAEKAEFQAINGHGVKFTADKKIILSRKFISQESIDDILSISKFPVDLKNIFCNLDTVYGIESIYELSYSQFTEKMASQPEIFGLLDASKLVYMITLSGTPEFKPTIFEDSSYRVPSTNQENWRVCGGVFTFRDSTLVAQYHSPNEITLFSTWSSPSRHLESLPRFYTNLEAKAYSPDDFEERLKTFESPYYVNPPLNSGNISYSKSSKQFLLKLSEKGEKPETTGCNYTMQLYIHKFYKEDFKNVFHQIISLGNSSDDPGSSVVFLDPLRISVDKGSDIENGSCQYDWASLQDLVKNSTEYILGITTAGRSTNFFIFSKKKMKFLLNGSFFHPI